MSLHDDVNAGLKRLSGSRDGDRLELDSSGACSLRLAPPPFGDGTAAPALFLAVRLGKSGNRFSMSSNIALIKGEPRASLMQTLLNRQLFSNQTDGMSFALNLEDATLVLVYHWILSAISPEQFVELFEEFALGVYRQIEEMATMARRETSLRPLYPGLK